jgi:hypothetical protein
MCLRRKRLWFDCWWEACEYPLFLARDRLSTYFRAEQTPQTSGRQSHCSNLRPATEGCSAWLERRWRNSERTWSESRTWQRHGETSASRDRRKCPEPMIRESHRIIPLFPRGSRYRN